VLVVVVVVSFLIGARSVVLARFGRIHVGHDDFSVVARHFADARAVVSVVGRLFAACVMAAVAGTIGVVVMRVALAFRARLFEIVPSLAIEFVQTDADTLCPASDIYRG
jgi:hypothetical protein